MYIRMTCFHRFRWQPLVRDQARVKANWSRRWPRDCWRYDGRETVYRSKWDRLLAWWPQPGTECQRHQSRERCLSPGLQKRSTHLVACRLWSGVEAGSVCWSQNAHPQRKSRCSKNEIVRKRLTIVTFHNRLTFREVVCESWFSSKENMRFITHELQQQCVWAIKANRTVARSLEEKATGKCVQVAARDMAPKTVRLVSLKGGDFPVLFAKQHFTNKDGSLGGLYLVSSETALTYQQLTTRYHKRWKIEAFHQSVKPHASWEKSPTKTVRTQKNHLFASMCAFVKLEQLKLKTKLNHVALKSRRYLKAIQTSFKELEELKRLHRISFRDCQCVTWVISKKVLLFLTSHLLCVFVPSWLLIIQA